MDLTELDPKSTDCLICGYGKLLKFKAQASDTKKKESIDIAECKECGFAWQYPLKRNEIESIEYFEEAYYGTNDKKSEYFEYDKKHKIATLEFGFVKKLPIKNKTLLDIGAGAGVFAEVAAENGWSVSAVDPALDVSRLKNNNKIHAIKGGLDKIPEGELFDVVCMWDVIEHLPNPIESITNAKKHLKEGGWLIIETGNYKSANRVLGGRKHWIYQLDHKWYFSIDSIKKLLLGVGFNDFLISKTVLRDDVINEINYPGPSRLLLCKSIFRNPFHALGLLKEHKGLVKASKWEMSGVGIFTVAARNNVSLKNQLNTSYV